MRSRSLVFARIATLALLTGCVPLPHVNPAIPAALRPHGATAGTLGAIFRYAGSSVTSGAAGTQRSAIAQTVTVSATPYPYGPAAGAADFHGVEIDRSGSGTTVWTSDDWRGPGAPNRGTVPWQSYGSRIGDGAGDTFLYRYPAPLVLDQAPERNGASWSNPATLLYREQDADGTAATAAYAPNGAYSENVQYPASACGYASACRLSIATSAAGAARYSGSVLLASGIDSIALSAPRAGEVTVVYTYTGGYQQSEAVPQWFPSGVALYAESDSIRTGVVFPPACAVPAAFGSAGNAVLRSISQVDPAAGTLSGEVTQTYTSAAYGTVCAVYSSTVQHYYDVANAVYSSVPIATDTVAETLTLRSAKLAGVHELDRRLQALAVVRDATRKQAALRTWRHFAGAGRRAAE
ncbi:MAG: hypothetical protein JO199_06600 [Candidatus Eremiobacteraeota bacterium]|nr:hypothetical protein [Candidatus Eremiobacteraeota bacterium]